MRDEQNIYLVTVKELPKQPGFEWLTERAVRQLIFKSKDYYNSKGQLIKGNGLDNSGAVIRLGRKILIDPKKFNEWVISQNKNK